MWLGGRLPPSPDTARLLFQDSGSVKQTPLPSILGCVKLCGGLVKSTNKENEPHLGK